VSTGYGTESGGEPRHGVRIFIAWAVLTAILEALVIWVIGPHIPPKRVSSASGAQHEVDVFLTYGAVPVLTMIWVYFGYAITYFRAPSGDRSDGPPITGNPRVQAIWLGLTTFLVLALAITGTFDLLDNAGAGSGEGSNPLSKPANVGKALQVQVIGQQWLWTFRYPSYGGVETTKLVVPVGRQIEFHVTSLDVVHSFWAIELGVKADAVPGADNIAFVRAYKTGSFQVRCDELCGLFHGHMNTTGSVVSTAKFNTWIHSTVTKYAGVTKYLPPYSLTYYPQPIRNAT
jgi:cytochrome c oxidase subunit II